MANHNYLNTLRHAVHTEIQQRNKETASKDPACTKPLKDSPEERFVDSKAGRVMQSTILDLQQQLTAKDWLLLQVQASWASTNPHRC